MELFLPSVIVLLLAAAVVFFLLPKFGPATLAIVSAILLAFGLYQHYSTFATEYRFSTWQYAAFSPYFLVGGLLLVIAAFFLYTIPVSSGAPNATPPNVEMPTVAEMPPASTSTNALTGAINRSLNTAANLFNGKGNGGNNGKATTGGVFNNLTSSLNRSKGGRGLNFPFSQV